MRKAVLEMKKSVEVNGVKIIPEINLLRVIRNIGVVDVKKIRIDTVRQSHDGNLVEIVDEIVIAHGHHREKIRMLIWI
jgi:hypothetical protein